MSADQMIELARSALLMALVLAAPVLCAALIVGLITSALQTVTQLQDQSLSFVPKLVIVLLVVLVSLPWGLELMVEFSTELYRGIPSKI